MIHRCVAFDTTSLGNLAKSRPTPAQFRAALERLNCRPLQGISTTQSLLGKPERVREQFLALRELGLRECPVLVFHAAVTAAERARVQIGGPWLYAWDFQELFDRVTDEVGFEEYVTAQQAVVSNIVGPLPRDHGARLVEWWHALPERARRERKSMFGAKGISEDVVGPRGVITRYIVERGATEGYADVAFGDPQNHRANLAFAGLLSLFLLAKLMHGEHTPTAPFLKTEPDDRNDANIVAEAAYCDMFVTDDANLRARLLFLRERGCVFFDVLSTASLLGRAGDDTTPA